LEIGGTGYAFNIREGDICIMDSSSLYHGSRDYNGAEDPSEANLTDRVVGIFILWKSYLQLKGVPKTDVGREDYLVRTKPDWEVMVGEKKRKRKKRKEKARKKRKKLKDKVCETEEEDEEEVI
jgi:hypothetical protein